MSHKKSLCKGRPSKLQNYSGLSKSHSTINFWLLSLDAMQSKFYLLLPSFIDSGEEPAVVFR